MGVSIINLRCFLLLIESKIAGNKIKLVNKDINKVNEIVAKHASLKIVFISTHLNRYYFYRFVGAVKQVNFREVLRYALLLVQAKIIPYQFYAHFKREKPPALRLINSGISAAGFSIKNSFLFDIWGEASGWSGNRDLLLCLLFERN